MRKNRKLVTLSVVLVCCHNLFAYNPGLKLHSNRIILTFIFIFFFSATLLLPAAAFLRFEIHVISHPNISLIRPSIHPCGFIQITYLLSTYLPPYLPTYLLYQVLPTCLPACIFPAF
jgi:hypothetical protein